MAKTVEIEIIDKKLQTTTTGGGIVTTHQNNVPNNQFNNNLGSGNVGQAGCAVTFNPLNPTNPIGFNIDVNSGTPNNTNWFPVSFKSGAGGANSTSFCEMFYRETPLPYRNASAQCVFPGTIEPNNLDNFVRNGFFTDGLGNDTGFVGNTSYNA